MRGIAGQELKGFLVFACLAALAATVAMASKVELILEDTDVAAWMTTNNSFTRPIGEDPNKWDPNHLWDGVLIQLGEYETAGDLFESITFEAAGNKILQTLKRGDFEWINIVAEDPNRQPPMKVSDTRMLFPQPYTISGCFDVDQHVNRHAICPTSTCPNAIDLRKLPKQCIRMRSLHGFFTPFAIITYWHGAAGYTITVGKHKVHGAHVFEFKDKVDVYKDGAPMTFNKPLAAIRINLKPEDVHRKRYHANQESPPWMP